MTGRPPPHAGPLRLAGAVGVLAVRLLLGTAAVAAVIVGRALWSMPDRAPVDPRLWSRWWRSHEPLDTVAGIAALLAVVALAWLLGAAVVHAAVACRGSRAARGRTARLLPRALAGLISTAVLGAGPGSLAAAHAQPPGPPAPPGGAAPTMVVIEDGPPDAVTPARQRGEPLRLTVRPGDHLWGIAARRVRLATGTEPTEAEIRPYWLALVEANRDRLVHDHDPDLLRPGQELVLPG